MGIIMISLLAFTRLSEWFLFSVSFSVELLIVFSELFIIYSPTIKKIQVSFGEYVHVSSSGIVFEWDTSFDGQCGNTIVSNSVADYLDTWTKQVP